MNIVYPRARMGEDSDSHHGEVVPDPYRWLEDADSHETTSFVAAENRLTESYLSRSAAREEIRLRLSELWEFERRGVPFKKGGRWFGFRNPGLANQRILYVMDAPTDEGAILLDPNELSADGTVAVSGASVSPDGRLLAYATSDAGSDWMTWHVRSIDSSEDLPDILHWSKFGGAAWLRDGSGFYYTANERPEPGAELVAETRGRSLMFHRLGTPQDDDELFFAVPDEPEWLPEVFVTEDRRFVVVVISIGTRPELQLRVLDLDRPHLGLRPLVGDFSALAEVVTNIGSVFYVLTDAGAERRRLVAIDLDDPDRSRWREVIAETADTLVSVHQAGPALVCHYLHDAHSVLRVHDLEGAHMHDVDLPGIVSVADPETYEAAISASAERSVFYFMTTSFLESGALWCHDVATGTTTLVRPSGARFDPSLFVTEQVFATSADGTAVPMFLSHRRDVSPDGDVPILMHGYGGFNIPVTPAFRVEMVVFMERGGVFAETVLRGGGEYGRAWNEAGKLASKQNVFDDFAACARWFVEVGWSRRERIAITGGSNGGLLVGASITQHPELFGAAISEVGVLDMLRFHKFTIGWAWTSDFGSPEDPEQYHWLKAYSPLHHITPATSYPPTLIMTGDHDDRVVPGHSLKFAAALQAAQGGPDPVLLRVETSAGHGAGKPTAKRIAERTDFLTFLDLVIG